MLCQEGLASQVLVVQLLTKTAFWNPPLSATYIFISPYCLLGKNCGGLIKISYARLTKSVMAKGRRVRRG